MLGTFFLCTVLQKGFGAFMVALLLTSLHRGLCRLWIVLPSMILCRWFRGLIMGRLLSMTLI